MTFIYYSAEDNNTQNEGVDLLRREISLKVICEKSK